MRSLIRKEWRESRALILGFLVLAPLASLALRGLIIGFEKTSRRANCACRRVIVGARCR